MKRSETAALLPTFYLKCFKNYPKLIFYCYFLQDDRSLEIVYLFKSVDIVTEWISGDNDTNKRNNCLNLIFGLNVCLNDEYQRHFIDKLI